VLGRREEEKKRKLWVSRENRGGHAANQKQEAPFRKEKKITAISHEGLSYDVISNGKSFFFFSFRTEWLSKTKRPPDLYSLPDA